jgi:hypothetical protein
MRSRLTMKLMGIVVLLVLTVLTAKACSGSGASPMSPLNIANSGVAGICADQHAVAASSGDGAFPDGSSSDSSPGTVISQSGLAQLGSSDPAGAAALEKTLGGNLSCATTTTAGTAGATGAGG